MQNEPTYLGKVLSVAGSSLNVELTPQVKSGLLIIEGKTHRIGQVGSFVRIPQGYNNLYGVISETGESASIGGITEAEERRTVKVELVGESIGIDFERGISQFPSINDEVHIVTESDLKTIYGNERDGQVVIGKLSSSDSINVGVDLDNLVNRHSALLGSTGSGKSTSVASLLRSIVTGRDGGVTMPSARIVLFDIHGEYAAALDDIATVFAINPMSNEKGFYIPFWCVSPESLIEFLCGQHEGIKNKFMDAIVKEKRYFVEQNRHLNIDIEKVTAYTPVPFRLKKIWYDLSYEDSVTWKEKAKENPAIIDSGDAERVIPPQFEPPGTGSSPPFKGNTQQSLKKQLDQMRSRLLDGQYSFFLTPGPWTPDKDNKTLLDLPDLIKEWVGYQHPVTILDLSGMPSDRLDLLLGSVVDILFESAVWGRNLNEGMKQKPLLLVMEEAHRYLSKENNGLSKDMVRRIAKEGRKFGVGSMLVSQRPSEIDETILSQCGTLFALRINNATDRARVKAAMSDGLSGIVDFLPILRTGEAIITGEAAKLPMRCKFRLPTEGRFPDSRDPKVSEMWSSAFEDYDYQSLASAWRQQNVNADPDMKK